LFEALPQQRGLVLRRLVEHAQVEQHPAGGG
jgi:hypothetical protein